MSEPEKYEPLQKASVSNSNHSRTSTELQISIYIETLTGTTFEMQLLPSETIYDVKEKIRIFEGIAVLQQCILWKDKELSNDKTLEECGIGHGALLRLVLNLRSGPITQTPVLESEIFDELSEETRLLSRNSAQSGSLTVLVFHNGDQIKIIAITPSLSIQEGDSRRSSQDVTSVMNFEDQSRHRLREEENLQMKQKVAALQEKLQNLALSRNEAIQGKHSTENAKSELRQLPKLSAKTTNTFHEKEKCKKKQKDVNGTLPPLTSRKKKSRIPVLIKRKNEISIQNPSPKLIQFFKRKKKPLISNIAQSAKKGTKSFSANIFSKADFVLPKSEIYDLDLKRPKTVSLFTNLNNSFQLLKKEDIQRPIQNDSIIKTKFRKSPKTPQKLPPLSHSPKNKPKSKSRSKKTRCTFCRKRLNITMEFKCRKVEDTLNNNKFLNKNYFFCK